MISRRRLLQGSAALAAAAALPKLPAPTTTVAVEWIEHPPVEPFEPVSKYVLRVAGVENDPSSVYQLLTKLSPEGDELVLSQEYVNVTLGEGPVPWKEMPLAFGPDMKNGDELEIRWLTEEMEPVTPGWAEHALLKVAPRACRAVT